ncbi:hypothetical protein H1R20_g12990, partial [Candolleomyces eurysporus]
MYNKNELPLNLFRKLARIQLFSKMSPKLSEDEPEEYDSLDAPQAIHLKRTERVKNAAAAPALPFVYAWGAAGHEIVATIAQIHLHPSVLPVICELLDIEPSDHSEATLRRQCHLAPIATWADRERVRMPWSSAMHYIEAVDDHPGDDCQYPGAGGWAGTNRINLLDAIKNVTGILAEWSGVDEHDNSERTLLVPTAPRRATFLRVGGERPFAPRPAGPREEEAFRFLVHFIGDLHQPLHLTGRQRGGNANLVYFEGRLSNLHRVWDTGLLTRLIRIVPPKYSSPLPDRGDLPIPSQQIELALRHAIYDPLIRRVMWEGIEREWINDIDGWLSCPAVPTPVPESQSESILSVVSRAFSNPWTLPRALLNIVSSAPRERVDILPDGPLVCPYAWSTPVHALNCKYVWPLVLKDNTTEPEVEEASHARAAKPPILDTRAYMAALDDNLVLEKLVAQGGLRLAALFDILQPIIDASHTRDRKRSPPDSACFPGTRLRVIRNVNTWARSDITTDSEPHVRWMHGYVGSGKSSISQEVCDTSERDDRPVISFFFFRNAGDRSKIWRLATTLANQMASVIPQTEPFIREAVQANPALLAPGEGGVSLRARMQCLVYAPFKAVVQRKKRVRALTRGPFLMVLDGLDECNNKDEVQELIDGMLAFFNENPLIPLRVFVTSRVEEHIHSRLNVPAVRLDNLVDHCSDDDIATFLKVLFDDGCRRNAIVRAYVQQHGEWPTPKDRRKLVRYIGGSFVFASAVFNFIMAMNTESSHPVAPMDRLPLALKMNPGLDGLYAQTLSRSKHLPHFSEIISTIALLDAPLPTSGIAELLGIHTEQIPAAAYYAFWHSVDHAYRGKHYFKPSESDFAVQLCREALALQPGNLELVGTLANAVLGRANQTGVLIDFDEAVSLQREVLKLQPVHLCSTSLNNLGGALVDRHRRTGTMEDLEEAISLYREALKQLPYPYPHRSTSLSNLVSALQSRHRCTGTMADLEEIISLLREALELRPYPHPDRSDSLNDLGYALRDRHQRTGTTDDLEDSISMHREALELRPLLHPDRPESLNNLGNVLLDRHQRTGTTDDLEEGISMHREALELRPLPHPDRHHSLNNLGGGLLDRHRHAGAMADLEEAISLFRDVLELQPLPRPFTSAALGNLVISLQAMYKKTHTLSHLQEAIVHCGELLAYYHVGHQDRAKWLLELASLLQMRFDATGKEDLAKLTALKEEGPAKPTTLKEEDSAKPTTLKEDDLAKPATLKEEDPAKPTTLKEDDLAKPATFKEEDPAKLTALKEDLAKLATPKEEPSQLSASSREPAA